MFSLLDRHANIVQDTLVRVFSLLGKTDTRLENPRAYLIRTAANLWIDRIRRSAREQAALLLEKAEPESVEPHDASDARPAARQFFQTLHPQERAALLMKDVFELSLEETAAMLHTTVGAVKSALSRARGRLDGRKPPAGFDAPPKNDCRAIHARLTRQRHERHEGTVRRESLHRAGWGCRAELV